MLLQEDETQNTATMVNIGDNIGGGLTSLSKKLKEACRSRVVEILSSAA